MSMPIKVEQQKHEKITTLGSSLVARNHKFLFYPKVLVFQYPLSKNWYFWHENKDWDRNIRKWLMPDSK